MPRISCIIPVYNTEMYLGQCLDSILAQSFSDYEVLMVNDGSTDSSKEICAEYEKRDSRFRLIDKANGGVSSARNSGLCNSSGDYILFVDSDDYVDPDYFRTMLSLVDGREDALGSCCVTLSVDGHDNPDSDDSDVVETYDFEDGSFAVFFERFGARIMGCLVYPRRLLQENHIAFDERLGFNEDTLFNLHAYACCRSIIHTHRCLYTYRINRLSATRKVYVEYSCEKWIVQFNRERDAVSAIAIPEKDRHRHLVCLYYSTINNLITNACAAPSFSDGKAEIREIRRRYFPLLSPTFMDTMRYFRKAPFRAGANLVLVKMRAYRLIRFIRIRNRLR